jgi:hypothetical protein
VVVAGPAARAADDPRRDAVTAGDGPAGPLVLASDGDPVALVCDNETNAERVFGLPSRTAFPKDGIGDHVVQGAATVSPDGVGTKGALHHRLTVPPGRRGRSGSGSLPARDGRR